MKVLITFPRFGSTWIQKYINKENTLNYGSKDLYDYFGKKHVGTTLDKIAFLENERINGQEYSVKYFTYHEPVLMGWTKDFYKNSTIIKLKRRNLYRAFLSYVAQYETKWKYHNAKTLHDLTIYNQQCNNLTVSADSIKEWFNRYSTFINFKDYDEELIYEDFIPNNPKVKSTIKYDIDYETRIVNIEYVQKEYTRCMKLLN